MLDLIWNGSLCAQTVFFDDVDSFVLQPQGGAAQEDDKLTSSSTLVVDFPTWRGMVTADIDADELDAIGACNGVPVNTFMHGTFGNITKYAAFLGASEEAVNGKH